MNMRGRLRFALVGIGAVALGSIAFVITREISSNERADAQPATPNASATVFDPTPDLTVTPDASATPDLTEPGWYVPYLNRDRELPRLEAEINGILISGEPPPSGFPNTATQACDSGLEREIGDEADARWGSSPIGIDESEFPVGQRMFDRPTYTVCGGSQAVSMRVTVSVDGPHADTELGSGSIRVRRWIGPGYSGFTAAEERWSGGEVRGQPAAILRPVIESIGTSAVIVHDPETGVTTSLVGEGVYLEAVQSLMEEILQ